MHANNDKINPHISFLLIFINFNDICILKISFKIIYVPITIGTIIFIISVCNNNTDPKIINNTPSEIN